MIYARIQFDVYEEHLKEGVTRDKIKSFMAKEKWFSGAELAEYFDVLIDEKAAVAACASDYFEKYNHVPESIKGTATRTLSMRCLRNWRTGTMQQQRQRNRESRQKSRIFLQTSTCMEFKKERT